MQLALQEFQGLGYVIQIRLASGHILLFPYLIVHLIAHRSNSGSYEYIEQQNFQAFPYLLAQILLARYGEILATQAPTLHLIASPDRVACHI